MNANDAKAFLVGLSLALAVSGCASARIDDGQRLALYQAHAGAPVSQVRYYDPIGWERVDGQHVALQMRPNETWLLTLSGPCLDWGGGSPFLKVVSSDGMTLSTFDRVQVPGGPMSCQIREIRPLDTKAVRAAEKALRAQAKVQASGT
ncbi:DUF6491 family protein [Thermomonas alba]|uniref:DUF6491 family protein n=1 Tax=Thermomonas alba TaxID=2888525 RepID=UPI001F036475|nr:DUF6491 family protein [Thermomonas alba]